MEDFVITKKHGIPGELNLTIAIYQQANELLQAIFPSLSESDQDKVFEVVFHCIYKLGAIKYHHDNFLQEWGERFDAVRQQKSDVVVEESKLAFELEGFIFQIKSCLDAIIKIFNPLIGIILNTYGDYGDSVIDVLNNNVKDEYKQRAEKLKNHISNNKPWIKYLIEYRDELYHHLHNTQGIQNFFFMKTDKPGALVAPKLKNGGDARLLVQNAWHHIYAFVIDFLALAIYIRMNPVFKIDKIPVQGEVGIWRISLDQNCIKEKK